MTTEEDGNSLDGIPPEQFAPVLVARGATVVGLNCSVGPAPMLETIERIAEVVTAPLAAQPNAGKPRDIEGRNLYLCSPDYMASYARRFVALGVRLVGGCCGTTPEHIRQIQLALKAMAPGLAHRDVPAPEVRTPLASQPHAQVPVARAEKSGLARRLSEGRFVTIVEVPPPRGHDPADALAAARLLQDRGVDVVTIPDGPRSGARLSALSLAVLVAQLGGIETLLQYSCRDRNLLGIQSDLLGAHAHGLRNLLGITGDVRSLGDIPDATAVFYVDSIGLTNVISRLNHGLDVGGQPIGPPTRFHTGVMANPSRDLDQEIKRLAYKVDAGAEFVVTRPVFDVATFERFRERVARFGLPVIVKGILHPDDARLAIEHGAAGIGVSNHGGRQLDNAIASLDALPAIAEVVEGRVPILLDGGVRRGTDVLVALAAGASAVGIGRPVIWGLAVDGETGVGNVLDLLTNELSNAMALSGAATIADVTPDLLA